MSFFVQQNSLPSLRLPTTRYQGSKRRAGPWLHSILNDLQCKTILDVFGGSASFSYLCKQMGRQVTYNDFLKFNSIIGKAIIENDTTILSDTEINRFSEINPTSEKIGFIAATFRGIYFTEVENRWLDEAIQEIIRIRNNNQQTQFRVALLYYSVIQSCLSKRPFNLFHRNNLDLRMRHVPRSFGNKATWDRPFGVTFKRFAQEVNSFVFKGRYPCISLQHDALEIPHGTFDLVYVDPPYLLRGMKNETADYLSSYHFLEGMVSYKEWSNLIDYGTSTRTLKTSTENPWIDKRQNSSAFDALFEKYRDSVIMVSCKRYGTPCLETIKKKLTRLGKSVRYKSVHYTYALSKQNGSAKYNREYIIIAE